MFMSANSHVVKRFVETKTPGDREDDDPGFRFVRGGGLELCRTLQHPITRRGIKPHDFNDAGKPNCG